MIKPQDNIILFLQSVYEMIGLMWKSQRRFIIALVFLSCLQGILPIASAWLNKLLFDLIARGLVSENILLVLNWMVPLLAAQALCSIGAQICVPVNAFFMAEIGRHITLELQTTVYQKLYSLQGLAYFEKPSFYDLMRVGSESAKSYPVQILSYFITGGTSIVTLVSFLSLLFIFNFPLAIMVCVAVLPTIFIHIRLSRLGFQLVLRNAPQMRYAAYYGYLLSGVEAAKEVRLFGLGDYLINAFRKITMALNKDESRQQLYNLRWNAFLTIFSSIVSNAAFIVVVWQAFTGHLSIGDIMLYAGAVTSLQGVLSALANMLANIHQNTLFYKRYKELMSLPDTLEVIGKQAVPPLLSGIEMRDVWFRYSENSPWVLQKLNLFIPAQKRFALVGVNGAGKTTLIKLLLRFYDPTCGQIYWDGVDIREYDPMTLRQRISTVFQDFMHYDLTAQENVGVGNVDLIHDYLSVQKAAQYVGLHETIQALPRGYQTVLSRWLTGQDEGLDLSGGQWQKIAIARAFMRKADFVILDEPTAALDAQAEDEIYERFVSLTQECTSLLISHRFGTVHLADTIAVLEAGSISEYGSHNELLRNGKTYRKLYELQAQRYEKA